MTGGWSLSLDIVSFRRNRKIIIYVEALVIVMMMPTLPPLLQNGWVYRSWLFTTTLNSHHYSIHNALCECAPAVWLVDCPSWCQWCFNPIAADSAEHCGYVALPCLFNGVEVNGFGRERGRELHELHGSVILRCGVCVCVCTVKAMSLYTVQIRERETNYMRRTERGGSEVYVFLATFSCC